MTTYNYAEANGQKMFTGKPETRVLERLCSFTVFRPLPICIAT